MQAFNLKSYGIFVCGLWCRRHTWYLHFVDEDIS